MSSSGIQAISSGPLIIRTYNNSSSSDVTYVLKDYDYPVSSNYVLITSTNGKLVPSDNIYVSSIITSSLNSDFSKFSTIYLSTVFGMPSVQFYSPIKINNNPETPEVQLFVNGSTVFSEPGAQSTPQIAGVNIFGLPNGNTINTNFTNSTLYTINDPVSKINFQLIGAGGSNIYGSGQPNVDLPGIGAYISGTLAVKQGDKLQIFTGTVGDNINSSKGTSLIYLSSIGNNIFVSTIVCIAGAGGGNGWAPLNISSSSGGGHGGGGNGSVTTNGNIDYIRIGSGGYDAISTLTNGNYQIFADGGQGGQLTSGGNGGTSPEGWNGANGGTPVINDILTTGGLANGGAGGVGTKTGGYGGGGYTGGGGGAASVVVSAGGGGGATYIATSTLKNYLSNLVCLGGEWISQNNATPFGEDYGLPNNPGYVAINGYEPNDTLYTNGDIECRVLRYEQLDPPINAIGGASALWALYPAIDIVHMNDNQIVECGGIHIDTGGIDVKNFIDINAGNNDILGSGMANFIRTASSGTYTTDYQVAGDSTGFGSGPWQDARYVYNPNNTPNFSQVWGIVTSSNITSVGSTIGDIHFYKSAYVDGNIGIKTINPGFSLDVSGNIHASTFISTNTLNMDSGIINNVTNISTFNTLYTSTANIRTSANTNIYYSQNPTSYDAFKVDLNGANLVAFKSSFYNGIDGTFLQNNNGGQFVIGTDNPILFINGNNLMNNNIGIGTNNPTTNLQIVGTVSTNNLVTSSITTNAPSLNIVSQQISTIGNLNVSETLNVGDNLNVTNITTLSSLFVSSITTNAPSLNIVSQQISTIGNLNVSETLNVGDNLNVTNITTLSSLFVSSITSNAPSLNIVSQQISTIGKLSVSETLNVYDITTLSGLIVKSIGTYEPSLNIYATQLSTVGNLSIFGNQNIAGSISTFGSVTSFSDIISFSDIYAYGNISTFGSITSISDITTYSNIYAYGNITAGSDIRFKSSINTIENALSTVKNIRGVTYYSLNEQTRKIGVIAQEIEKVLPEVVLTDNSPEQYKSVAYGNIVSILIESVKELSNRIEILENKIANN